MVYRKRVSQLEQQLDAQENPFKETKLISCKGDSVTDGISNHAAQAYKIIQILLKEFELQTQVYEGRLIRQSFAKSTIVDAEILRPDLAWAESLKAVNPKAG
jgi:hypothetical protein